MTGTVTSFQQSSAFQLKLNLYLSFNHTDYFLSPTALPMVIMGHQVSSRLTVINRSTTHN